MDRLTQRTAPQTNERRASHLPDHSSNGCNISHFIHHKPIHKMTIPTIDELHTIWDDQLGERLFFACHELAFDIDGYETTIPAGFLSDGLSIPRWAQPLINTSASPQFIVAGIYHDYLYKVWPNKKITRKEADILFLKVMKGLGVGFWRRRTIYLGVRAGGFTSWHKRFPRYRKHHHHK